MAGFDLTIEHVPADRRTVREIVLLLLVCVLAMLANTAHAAPSGFTFCSGEGEPCDLRNINAYVTFGAGEGSCDLSSGLCTGTYSPLIQVDSTSNFYVVCRLSLFPGSDPAPGVGKSCFWIASAGTSTSPPAPAASGTTSSSAAVFPWSLTAEDGLVLGAAILSVWAAAFAARAAIRALGSDNNGGDAE